MSDKTPLEQSVFTPIQQSLFESRAIILNGAVDGKLMFKVNSQLLAMEKSDPEKPIVIWINSPGGEINSGFGIYDMIQFIQPKVITVVSGLAASMGSVIALAAEKENRLSFPNSKLLIHQPLIGGVMRGQASDIEIHAKDIIETKKKLHRLYADRTGTDIKKFEELMERDRWVNPDEAIELGLISKIIKDRTELNKHL